MKTLAEFNKSKISEALKLIDESKKFSHNPIQIIIEKLKVDQKKAEWMILSCELVGQKLERLSRVLVLSFEPNETPAFGAIQKGTVWLKPEYAQERPDEKPRSVEACLAAKPESLGEIETELRAQPPRKISWKRRSGAPLSSDSIHLLENWMVVRGWVVGCLEEYDSEGPDFYISYAYEINQKVFSIFLKVGYDKLHWALSAPEHQNWFYQSMKKGHTLTVLVDPKNPERSIILGQVEAFDWSSGSAKWVTG